MLARIGQLEPLRWISPVIHIATQVFDEIVIAGAGKPGSAAVAAASWIQVVALQDLRLFELEQLASGLGAGEVSAVQLAKELNADIILMDDWKGRQLATESGYAVTGCVGILEELYRDGKIEDLSRCYQIGRAHV